MFLWNLLSEPAPAVPCMLHARVLILVFVEFTLRVLLSENNIFIARQVLILVFVEFTLRADNNQLYERREIVLILVFVEFTLRALSPVQMGKKQTSLNPCFCGIYSQRVLKTSKVPLKVAS